MASIFFFFLAGEIPSYKIYEDEETYAFLHIHPEVRGHVLVIFYWYIMDKKEERWRVFLQRL